MTFVQPASSSCMASNFRMVLTPLEAEEAMPGLATCQLGEQVSQQCASAVVAKRVRGFALLALVQTSVASEESACAKTAGATRAIRPRHTFS